MQASHLLRLTGLKRLNIAGTQITDDGLRALGGRISNGFASAARGDGHWGVDKANNSARCGSHDRGRTGIDNRRCRVIVNACQWILDSGVAETSASFQKPIKSSALKPSTGSISWHSGNGLFLRKTRLRVEHGIGSENRSMPFACGEGITGRAREGTRRTPQTGVDPSHSGVISAQSLNKSRKNPRPTARNIEPWPKDLLEKAYKGSAPNGTNSKRLPPRTRQARFQD